MKMNTGKELVIELIAKESYFDPHSVISAISGITDALSIIGNDLAESDELDTGWVIMQSPFQIGFSSRETQSKEFGEKVINKTMSLYDWLEHHPDLPEGYSRDIVEPLQSISAILNNGISQYKLKTAGRKEIISSDQLKENINKVVDLYTKESYTAFTTLKGKMQELTAKSSKGKPRFSLFVRLYKKKVNCVFDEDQFDDIKRLLEVNPVDIIVNGKAKYNAKGEPLSIEVKEYKKISDSDKIIQLDDLYEPDLTGNLDTSEHLFKVRNGEW